MAEKRPRILIVEDERAMAEAVAATLSRDYDTFVAGTLAAAEEQLAKGAFDLILLDATLPDGDGFKFCAVLKARDSTRSVPVIFTTGAGEIQDKTLGFQLGAEDYLTKPYPLAELKLRVAARLRSRAEAQERSARLSVGDLTLDVVYQKVLLTRDGKETEVYLTPNEFKLMHYLASREGKIASRETLIAEVWGASVHVTMRTVDTHLSNLRKKLEHSLWTVRCVHGQGYQWVPKSQVAVAGSKKKAA